jgi:hypothetical protein
MSDDDAVIYDLPPGIQDDPSALTTLLRDPEREWYARARLAALAREGLVSSAWGDGTDEVPKLASVDDLPQAVQAAMDNPDLRWWVERRVKAMGLEHPEFPWSPHEGS